MLLDIVLILGVLCLVGAGVGFTRNYRSWDPERLEAQEMAFWLGPDLKAPKTIDWAEFERMLELTVDREGIEKIDHRAILTALERDMALPYKCKGCGTRISQKATQCSTCSNVQVIDKFQDEAIPVGPRHWRCLSCNTSQENRYYQCQNCGHGFVGGGPFGIDEEGHTTWTNLWDAPGLTTFVNSKMSCRTVEPGETIVLRPGEIAPTPTKHAKRLEGHAVVYDRFDRRVRMIALGETSTLGMDEYIVYDGCRVNGPCWVFFTTNNVYTHAIGDGHNWHALARGEEEFHVDQERGAILRPGEFREASYIPPLDAVEFESEVVKKRASLLANLDEVDRHLDLARRKNPMS